MDFPFINALYHINSNGEVSLEFVVAVFVRIPALTFETGHLIHEL